MWAAYRDIVIIQQGGTTKSRLYIPFSYTYTPQYIFVDSSHSTLTQLFFSSDCSTQEDILRVPSLNTLI